MADVQTYPSKDLWILEDLLEQDNVNEVLIKEFYDRFSSTAPGSTPRELPAVVQTRLMLRVLREHPINAATLDELQCLAQHANGDATAFPPLARPGELQPDAQLMLELKTQVILHGGADAYEDALEQYFPAGGDLTGPEQDRRHDLVAGLGNPAARKKLVRGCPPARTEAALAAYVARARRALGPTFLQGVDTAVQHGSGRIWDDDAMQQYDELKAHGSKRRREGQLLAESRQARDCLRMMGTDPLRSVFVQPQAIEEEQAALEAAQQQPSEPSGSAPAAAAPGGSPALAGQQLTWSPEDVLLSNGSRKRRRNGRWTVEETELLMLLTQKFGKGKWKAILDEGGESFNNRSQVDLKDKWRNLEKQRRVPTTPGSPRATLLLQPAGQQGEAFGVQSPAEGASPPSSRRASESLTADMWRLDQRLQSCLMHGQANSTTCPHHSKKSW